MHSSPQVSEANLRDRRSENMEKTMLTSLFATSDKVGDAPKYQSLRQSARERFRRIPLPTQRVEDWRFTNIAPILETPFEFPRLSIAHLPPPSGDGLRFIFINGRFTKLHSSQAPNGVQIGSLSDGAIDLPQLTKIADDRENAFTALNSGLLTDGMYVIIPDGKVLEQPIEVEFMSAGKETFITNPRVLIVVGKNAQATVIERYVGAGHYFTNAVTEIALAEHAILDHVKMQQESTTAYHIANTQIVQAARSTFTSHYVALGGALVRNEVRVRFDGEHAESTVNGLYLAKGKQHLDNFTVIDHAKPNCASHELYKGILADQSHGVFNGKIFVRKDAQKTDAKQTNKVLLLSDDATINTKPQLEIFADDVKCTHGATIGQLDATQLFYLQSRGIPLDQARRLLTFAFANDVVSRIKIEAIRAELEAQIVM
jgi:Fe-S cluster assembly protein SufD